MHYYMKNREDSQGMGMQFNVLFCVQRAMRSETQKNNLSDFGEWLILFLKNNIPAGYFERRTKYDRNYEGNDDWRDPARES